MARKPSVAGVARSIAQRLNYCPLEHLISVATHPQCPLPLRVEIGKIIMPFLFPKKLDVAVTDERAEAQAQLERDVTQSLLGDADVRNAAEQLELKRQAARRKLLEQQGGSLLDEMVEEQERKSD